MQRKILIHKSVTYSFCAHYAQGACLVRNEITSVRQLRYQFHSYYYVVGDLSKHTTPGSGLAPMGKVFLVLLLHYSQNPLQEMARPSQCHNH